MGMKDIRPPFRSPLTTRGDLLTMDSTPKPSRLGIGSTGSVLHSDGTDVSWESISALLDTVSSTRGAILFRGASGWTSLSPGTNGDVLTSNGSGADPSYQAGGGGGGPVDSITGTANQIIASSSTGNITLSTAQDIGTSSSPSFASVTASAGTITSSAPGLDVEQTWNSGGTTFIGARINVVETAAASGSLALAIQQNGTTYAGFIVDASSWGQLRFYSGGTNTHVYGMGTTLGIRGDSGITMTCGGSSPVKVDSNFLEPNVDNAYDLGEASARWRNLVLSNTIQMSGTTGSSTVATMTNSPATVTTNPYTWLKFVAADGTSVFVPAWK